MTVPIIQDFNRFNSTLVSPQNTLPPTGASARPLPTSAISRMDISSINDPTQLILKSAMEKINDMFKPYLGEGAIQRAAESGQDLSPKATADSIISFASSLIGRTEQAQSELPVAEQRNRAQLFSNIQTGIENGFAQARDILDHLHALQGGTKSTVDETYKQVQAGLSTLAETLGIQLTNPTNS